MPTIHLSLPEAVYREVKRYSEHLGVQMTDLVKFMINKGLEELREKYGRSRDEELANTVNLLASTLESIDKRLQLLELRLKEQEIRMKEFMDTVESRISDLEMSVQELSEPIVEPELIEARARARRVKRKI